MTRNAWIVFIAVCVLIFGGLFVYARKDAVDVSNVDGTKINTGSESSGGLKDFVYGNPDAKVTLIEYGDFQCPACRDIHPVVKPLAEENKENMRFVFRNFPLSESHPNARAAAAAAEAAGIMGKYWEMHDALYERYSEWTPASGEKRTDIFKDIAKGVGLNTDEFMSILQERSDELNKKINFDKALGLKYGVNSTPTFFLNGEKLSGEQVATTEAFKKTVTDAIKDAK